uniref:Uncharacterized protein n=1 Tax=Solanum tuberosum TaxID=4113 RepID=M1D971_SOLTU
MLHQPYEMVSKLLDGMVEANKEAKRKQEWDALVTQLDVLSTRVTELETQAMKEEKHSSLRGCKHGRKQRNVQDDEAPSLIQQKIEAHEKMLNEMKENIKMLNKVSASHSMTIQLQDAQIGHLITGHYPSFAEDSPNYNMGNSEDEE